MKKLLAAYLILGMLLIAIPCQAFSNYTGFTTRATGYVIQASDWNNEFGNFIAYVNTNIIATLNLFTKKGHLLSFDGASFQIIDNAGAGDNGKLLQFDNTTTPGWKLSSIASTTALTTKGDLLGYAAALTRIPVGTDGQILTARSSNANGVAWEAGGLPTGAIILWSGTLATIPSGYALCDGVSNSPGPNLQGLFVVGAGNHSPAATGGMNLLAAGGPAGDTSAGTGLGPSHTHSVPITSPPAFAAGAFQAVTNAGPTLGTSVTPRYYALAYIQKQ